MVLRWRWGCLVQAVLLPALLAPDGAAATTTWSYTPPAATDGNRRYEGVRINLLFPHFIADGLSGAGTFFKDRIAEFCNETGASAVMTGKQFPGLYRQEMDTDMSMYDIFNFFGSWMPSLAQDGKLLRLTDYVLGSARIAWSDILPRVRKGVAEYQDEIYMLPADGDVIVMIYRKDLLDLHGLAKPETWEDFLAVSNYFRENVGPDGEGGRGACLMTKENNWAYANLFAYLGTWLQAHGPQQGIFFDPESMEPLFDTPAAREALAMWKQIVLSSSHVDRPCTDCRSDGEGSGLESMVEDMTAGRCMMGLNYMGPVKFIAGDAFNTENSTIALAPVPGSRRVRALEGDGVVDCNAAPTNCPYAVSVPRNENGRATGETHLINRATYFSGGGQSWAVGNSTRLWQDTHKQDAIWELLESFVTGDNAVLSTTAADYLLDPFRQSTLDDLQVQGRMATVEFMRNGWKWEQLGTMKETLNTVFNDPNGVLDLKIFNSDAYMVATDFWMLRYYVGNITLDEAIEGITADWGQRITLSGLNIQRNLYRSVLGLPLYQAVQLDCPAGQDWESGTCQSCAVGKYKATNNSDLCTVCRAGTYMNATGATACLSCNSVLENSTTAYLRSESASDCVCPAGSFWYKESPNATARCRGCSEGLSCPGFDDGTDDRRPLNRPPEQAGGYYAAAPDFPGAMPSSVVVCANAARCPPGKPLGFCPENSEGRACDLCSEDTYRSGDACLECEGSTSFFAWILVALGACAAMIGLYIFGTRATSPHVSSGMTLMLTAGLSIAAIQALGAFSKLSIEWVEPIASMDELLNLVTFRVELVRPSCIFGQQSPAMSYLASVLVYPAFAVSLSLVFFLAGVAQQRKIQRHQVVNSQGMVLMAAYLSLTMVAVLPWQCETNPDASQSVVAYRSVTCWEDSDHVWMLAMSVFATLAYVVSFLAVVVWAIIQYPMRVSRQGGMEFVREFHFLFARFASNRYYYSIIFLIRNMLLALLPVLLVNHPQVQVMLMVLVISVTGVLQSHFWPWRTEVANYVDAALSLALILILVAGALLLDLGHGNGKEVVQHFMIVVGLIAISCIAVILGLNVFMALRPPKRYGIFLSHHKVAAGVLARWFKMLLLLRTRDRVFLDSDDVSDLDKIIDTVAHDTKNVMVLLTRETLMRMWCAGEIATAMAHGVNLVLVECDDYEGLSEPFVESVPELWTESQKSLLASAGLEIELIQDCYRKLRAKETIKLLRFTTTHEQEAVVRLGAGACLRLSGTTGLASSFGASTDRLTEREQSLIQVLGSHKDAEAACICRVLKVYLQEALQAAVTLAIDGEASAVTTGQFASTKFLLVVLTPGVLENRVFAEILVMAHRVSDLKLVPVRADEAFVYPDTNYYQELAEGNKVQSEDSSHVAPADVEAAYKALFNKLAQRFTPHASETIQRAEVQMMTRHLSVPEAGEQSAEANSARGASGDDVVILLSAAPRPRQAALSFATDASEEGHRIEEDDQLNLQVNSTRMRLVVSKATI